MSEQLKIGAKVKVLTGSHRGKKGTIMQLPHEGQYLVKLDGGLRKWFGSNQMEIQNLLNDGK